MPEYLLCVIREKRSQKLFLHLKPANKKGMLYSPQNKEVRRMSELWLDAHKVHFKEMNTIGIFVFQRFFIRMTLITTYEQKKAK